VLKKLKMPQTFWGRIHVPFFECRLSAMKLLISIAISLFVTNVFGWGTQGHHVIVDIATAKMSPKAQQQVDQLLSLEPGETLVSISTWADEHRNPTTGRWHYINFPRNSCTYDQQRDCPDGQCVVEVINSQLDILASSASDAKRLTALKYVVHLVADVHQPLHAGYQEDRGGNTYQLQAFMRGSNLHALWDTGLIRNLNVDTSTFADRLKASILSATTGDLDVSHAAEESCKIVGIDGFYPERKVGVDYIERFTPIMEQRLGIAGVRLAGILNSVFR
jgi:hypothetical protein